MSVRVPRIALLACLSFVACNYDIELPPERRVEGVTTATGALVGAFGAGPERRAFLLKDWTEFETYYGGLDPAHEASFHAKSFFDNGGEDLWVVRAPDKRVDSLTNAIAALDEANRFETLLVPGLSAASAGPERGAALAGAVAYAGSRSAVMVADPPAELHSPGEVLAWLSAPENLVRSESAVMYFGRVKFEGRWIGASSAAAGAFARNDRERGVWQAPAGPQLPLAGVTDVTALSDREAGELNAAGVNPVRFSGGALLFGARTLSGDVEYRYLPARRMALHLDSLIRERLLSYEGRTPGDPLWAEAELSVEGILMGFYREGAFAGMKPEDAFFVRCDRTTNPAAVISGGRIRLVYGFAPLRPAEFVVREISETL